MAPAKWAALAALLALAAATAARAQDFGDEDKPAFVCQTRCTATQKACGDECVLRTTPCDRKPTTACDAEPSPSLCGLVAAKGSCDDSLERWYHNTATDKCEKFVWGGCTDGSNENRFESLAACEETCPSGNKVTPPGGDEEDAEIGDSSRQVGADEAAGAGAPNASGDPEGSGDAPVVPGDGQDVAAGVSGSSSGSDVPPPPPPPPPPMPTAEQSSSSSGDDDPLAKPAPGGDDDQATGFGEHLKRTAGLGTATTESSSAAASSGAAQEQAPAPVASSSSGGDAAPVPGEQGQEEQDEAKEEAAAAAGDERGPVPLAQEGESSEQSSGDDKAPVPGESSSSSSSNATTTTTQAGAAKNGTRTEFSAIPIVPPQPKTGNAPATDKVPVKKATKAEQEAAARVSESEQQIKADLRAEVMKQRAAREEAVEKRNARSKEEALKRDQAENEYLARVKAEMRAARLARRQAAEERLKAECRCERDRAGCASKCQPAQPCACAKQTCSCPVTQRLLEQQQLEKEQHAREEERARAAAAAAKSANLPANATPCRNGGAANLAGPTVTALLDADGAGKGSHRDRKCAEERKPETTTCFGKLVCPFGGAVCCDDQETCCPSTYKCVASNGATKCVPPTAA